MQKATFEHEMMKARTFITTGHDVEYWRGYERGLRRRFHGEAFGTDEEHELWLDLVNDLDRGRAERGRGYRDGYVPHYCTQNDGDCQTCSLANYRRDCRNNPI